MYEIIEFKSYTTSTPAKTPSFESVDDLLTYFDNLTQDYADIENTIYIFGKQLIPADKKIGKRRSREIMLESTQFVVLTIDCSDISEIDAAMEKVNNFHFIYHVVEDNYDVKKFHIHIIFPLLDSISPEDYDNKKVTYQLAIILGINEMLNDEPIKTTCKHYLPFSSDGEKNPVSCLVNTGKECLSLKDLFPELEGHNRSERRPRQSSVVNMTPNNAQSTVVDGIQEQQLVASKGDETKQMISVNPKQIDLTLVHPEMAEAYKVLNSAFGELLLFVNSKFYSYGDGIWSVTSRERIKQYLILNTYQSTKSSKDVEKVIESLIHITHNDTFPSCDYQVIALQDCAIHLDSFEILDHSPAHYAKSKLSFSYNQSAECPKWIAFLESIWGGDPDYQDKVCLLQEYMGLSMTTITSFQKMLWLVGEGSNGKSVIFDIVRELIGLDNCSSVAFQEFANQFSLAQLENKLVNIDSD
ncbi:MAG: hypothetical protein NTV98_05075, partial [Candidatus Roizmanbacteria bacterium]|nr:hypothetical protein [Candidatus Roizmanbacteria bacterium]